MQKRKSRKRKKGTNDKLFYRILISSGALFVLMGLYFTLSSNEGNPLLESMLHFLKSSPQPIMADNATNWSGLSTFCFYFSPAAIGIIFTVFYSRKFSVLTVIISVLFTIYLIVLYIHTNTTYSLFFQGISYFRNLYIALVFLFLPAIGLALAGFFGRKLIYSILCCIYFYASIHIYFYAYSDFYFNFILASIVFFNLGMIWLGIKTQRSKIHLITFIFSVLYLTLLTIKRFGVNSSQELVFGFIIFIVVFYLIQWVGLILLSEKMNQSLKDNRTYWFLSVGNMLFSISAVSYLVIVYYSFNYLWVFITVLFLINSFGLYLIKKYFSTVQTIAQEYIQPVLASLILPLVLHRHEFFLFFACLSGLFVIAEWRLRKSVVVRLSWISLVIATALFITLWSLDFIPALFDIRVNSSLLFIGFADSMIFLVALIVIKIRLQGILSQDAPRKSKVLNRYLSSIDLVLFAVIYLSWCWVVYSLICFLTGTTQYAAVGWFIASSSYFITLISYYSGKNSSHKKMILYVSYFCALCYPVLTGWNITIENLIFSGKLNYIALMLHYMSLGLFLMLEFMTIRRISLRNTKKYVTVKQLVQLLTVLYLLFVICIEYDNFTLIIQSFGFSLTGGLSTVKVDSNQFLPYSILMWILSNAVFIYGSIKKNPVFNASAVVLFIATVIKFFVYDFEGLEPGQRSLILIIVGLSLIVMALIYPKLKGKEKTANETSK